MSAATTSVPPITDFVYVDTAIGGPANRNRVMRLEDFSPPRNASDVFTTYFRYTNEFADYAANNPIVAPEVRPSVKGFRGQAFALFLPADFDCAEDLNRAREDAIRVVATLEARYDVPASAVRIAFSGSKGFSLEIPGGLFAGFAPAVDLPRRFKRLAGELFADCPTRDSSIYESVRLWRVVNSRHGKSGLYKVRLTLGELTGLSLEEIRRLAETPRPYQDAPDDDWFPRAGLVELWANTTIPENGHPRDAQEHGADVGSRPLTPEHERELIEVMATPLVRGPEAQYRVWAGRLARYCWRSGGPGGTALSAAECRRQSPRRSAELLTRLVRQTPVGPADRGAKSAARVPATR